MTKLRVSYYLNSFSLFGIRSIFEQRNQEHHTRGKYRDHTCAEERYVVTLGYVIYPASNGRTRGHGNGTKAEQRSKSEGLLFLFYQVLHN